MTSIDGEADRGDPSPVSAQVYAEVADVLGTIGALGFYDALSRFVARATGCDQRLVMRYAAFDRPAFVVNGFMTQEAVDLYLDGLYRLDPLQALCRTNRSPRVVSLRSAAAGSAGEEQYLAEIFRIAFIVDELAFLLPSHGGVSIAVCCEKGLEPFTDADRDHAAALLPLVAALHRQHIDTVFAAASRRIGQGETVAGLAGAIMVLDRAGRPVFANDAWRVHPGVSGMEEKVGRARAMGLTHLSLPDGEVVHWDDLGAAFSLAPGGTMLMLERRSDGPIRVGAQAAIDSFCAGHDLTPREADIVRLILLGYPNARIAETLGLSPGTVKNHRWRLYYKLDITTERELFHLFLSALLSLDAEADRSAGAGRGRAARAGTAQPGR
jgi:DNA-binding CsgD family transcriptional regulator